MSLRIGLLAVIILAGVTAAIGQNNQKASDPYFYDTLVIMDYNTNAASERLSRLRKPIKRNFYLKNNDTSYSLFKGQVANLSATDLMSQLDSGFSLYIDKAEHLAHKNLRPSIIEVVDENGEVIETLENKNAKLKRKLTKGKLIRLSGFEISVNEKKNGPIVMLVEITEK